MTARFEGGGPQGGPSDVHIEDRSPDGASETGQPEGSGEQRVTWLELFFDLIFVTAFDQLAKRLGDAPTGGNLLVFVLMFTAVWWAWAGNTTFAARYGNDSRAYRWGTLVQLLTLGTLTLTLRGDLSDTGMAFGFAYTANRLVLVGMYLLTLRTHPQGAAFARGQVLGFGAAALFWFASAFLQGTAELLAWGVALTIDVLTPILGRARQRGALPHQEHLPERVGLLQIIALGGIVTEVVAGSRQQELRWFEQAPSLLALVAAVAMWRLYFEQARALPVLAAHRAGRVGSLLAWLYGHLPFTLSIVMLAVGFGHGISDENGARDVINRQLVAWPLALACLTLLFLRWNASRVTRHPFLDLSAVSIGLAALSGISLAFLPLDTLATHAAACAVILVAAVVTALAPATRRLGRIEEALGGSGTPV
ncbi:low temperature requirement protein A [Deinococcus planocerae]|uniref:low temperature requirement protein A n=1 Tax=Deinococcus planocerae TaxID=1737569 RepID=UPI001FE5B16F|nr:low temperature requirement protein A [Deinococcus planocerae]